MTHMIYHTDDTYNTWHDTWQTTHGTHMTYMTQMRCMTHMTWHIGHMTYMTYDTYDTHEETSVTRHALPLPKCNPLTIQGNMSQKASHSTSCPHQGFTLKQPVNQTAPPHWTHLAQTETSGSNLNGDKTHVVVSSCPASTEGGVHAGVSMHCLLLGPKPRTHLHVATHCNWPLALPG